MLRKGLMKRLSKSAGDISGCKKRPNTTSPEEEEPPTDFPETTGNNSDYEEDIGVERPGVCEYKIDREGILKIGNSPYRIHKRPPPRVHIIESLSISGSSQSTRSATADTHRRRRHNPVSDRFGFLTLLRERFKSKSRDGVVVAEAASSSLGGVLRGQSSSPAAVVRKRIVAQLAEAIPTTSTPEIVRYRRTANNNNNNYYGEPISGGGGKSTTSGDADGSGRRPEVVRHHVTPMTSLPMALAQELEIAKAKEEREAAEAAAAVMNGEASSQRSSVDKEETSKGQQHSRHPIHQPQQQQQQQDVPRRESGDSFHSIPEDHLNQLRTHPCYLLHVHLKQGYDLAARDSNGSSDPYVKFLSRGKVVHKSKTVYKDLNPSWDEQFLLTIDDPFVPLDIKVS